MINKRIQYIDSWRFIAVWMVILAHTVQYSNLSFLVEFVPDLEQLGRFWTVGVMIFFFISGYVICKSLLLESKVYRSVI